MRRRVLAFAAAALLLGASALGVACTVMGVGATTTDFGYATVAATADSGDANNANGQIAALAQTGTLQSLSIYLQDAPAGSHIKLALYDTAGNLVAQTAEGAAVVGWNTLATPGVNVVAGNYWLLADTDNTGVHYVYDSVSGVTMGWGTLLYTDAFPASYTPTSTWPDHAFSFYGTIVPDGSTPTPTNTATSTATPVVGTATPTATDTATATPTSTPLPPTATPTSNGSFDSTYCATTLDAQGKSQCGVPTNFCDTWVGGFCNDYRYTQLAPGTERPLGSDPRDSVSVDCLSSTNAGQSTLPYYLPTNNTENTDVPGYEIIPFPCAFASMEHFMTRMEDGQFGMVVMRQQTPFDFAGRTGHIHLDLSLNNLERRYTRIVLSPDLTKTGVDDRSGGAVAQNAFDLWFRNGTFQGRETQNGVVSGDLLNSCNGCGPRYYGTINVRDSVDVYISRTHIRIDVNGTTYIDEDIPDIGFDRAYVYLEHVNYNSCKAYAVEGYATVAECQMDGNMFHWDNFAFDGPTLPKNSLTPAGSEDVVFNAFGQAACTVDGVTATSVEPSQYLWATWQARLPANTPVTAADVSCTPSSNGGSWYNGDAPGLEVVQQ